jgi:hypothetical protein
MTNGSRICVSVRYVPVAGDLRVFLLGSALTRPHTKLGAATGATLIHGPLTLGASHCNSSLADFCFRGARAPLALLSDGLRTSRTI